ncbi:hypothetical protein Ciccas_007885, partial [Cichlidogyrus casuarinus]
NIYIPNPRNYQVSLSDVIFEERFNFALTAGLYDRDKLDILPDEHINRNFLVMTCPDGKVHPYYRLMTLYRASIMNANLMKDLLIIVMNDYVKESFNSPLLSPLKCNMIDKYDRNADLLVINRKMIEETIWKKYIRMQLCIESFSNRPVFTDNIQWNSDYQPESIFPLVYGIFLRYDKPECLTLDSEIDRINVTDAMRYLPKSFFKRRKAAAAVISNWTPNLRRIKLIEEFRMTGFPLEIYGINSKSCPRENCYDQLSSEFMFYFSFENSQCNWYITEKVFRNALQHDMIPVVMGARRKDYEEALPPHSFIFADDFKNMRALADYLTRLANDSEALARFFGVSASHVMDYYMLTPFYLDFDNAWRMQKSHKEYPWGVRSGNNSYEINEDSVEQLEKVSKRSFDAMIMVYRVFLTNYLKKLKYVTKEMLEESRWAVHCVMGCQLLGERARRLARKLNWCPNPCKQKNVCLNENVVVGKRDHCEVTKEGIFTHQYKCVCVSEHFYYDEFVKRCLPKDPCTEENTKCSKVNTIGCVPTRWKDEQTNVIRMQGKCICAPGWGGSTCEESLNSAGCEEQVRHPMLPDGGSSQVGKIACNTAASSNKCIPRVDESGTPTYSCVCNTQHWNKDPSYRYDNCLLDVRDPCKEIACYKGQCLRSIDKKKVYCKCFPGYGGEGCLDWLGTWSAWSDWLPCRPNCGHLRYSVRHRNCLPPDTDARLDCVGEALQFHQCQPVICHSASRQVIERYFIAHNYNLLGLILTALLSSVALFIIFRKLAELIVLLLVRCLPQQSNLRRRLSVSSFSGLESLSSR